MTAIRFFEAKETTQYEYSRTYVVRDSDTTIGWGDVVNEGGHYRRRPRWCECDLTEATWLTLESMHPDGIHTARVAISVDSQDGREVVHFILSNEDCRCYHSLSEKLEKGDLNEDDIPLLVRRLMKAIGLHAIKKYGDCDYTRRFNKFTMANLAVEPLQASSFKPEVLEVCQK